MASISIKVLVDQAVKGAIEVDFKDLNFEANCT